MVKFILTNELGRLATWLRILGYDTVFSAAPRAERAQLVGRSLRESRIIITRDSKMSRYSGVRVIHIASDFVEEQLKQIIDTLRLPVEEEKRFTICVVCNAALKRIGKTKVKDKVPTYVYKTQNRFTECPACKRIYWQGTHWDMVRRFLETTRG